MFPLRDHNRVSRTPVVTYALIALNAIFFLYQSSLPPEKEERLVIDLGLKPRFAIGYLRGEDVAFYEELQRIDAPGGQIGAGQWVVKRPVQFTLTIWNSLFPFLSSMFLHGGWLHLLGNLWFLHIFGDNVEDRLGRSRFFTFYLLCGLGASVTQVLADPSSTAPCIGASGAISGVLGAYALIYPTARIVTLVPIFYYLEFMELPAFLFLFIWFGIQVLSGLFSAPGQGGVAWWAHIGGFAVGMLLSRLASKPSDPPTNTPWGKVRDVPFWIDRE